ELGPLRLHHAVLPNSTYGRSHSGLGGLRLSRRGALGIGFDHLRFRLIEHFALEYPYLDADDSVRRLRLGDAVVDIGTERVQGNASLAVGLRTGDFRPIEAAGDAHFDAQRAGTHGVGHRALHGATEHHPLFQLLRNTFGHEFRVEFGLANLGDIEPHVVHRHAENLGHGGAELFDVLALLADHDSRACRMNGDVG